MPSKKKTTKSNRTKPSWKTVELEDGHIAKGIPRDMIGIEELTDYRLVKKNLKTGKTQVKIVKTKPIKATSTNNNAESMTEVHESKREDNPIKKAKKKVKRQTSANKAHAKTEKTEEALKSYEYSAEKPEENVPSKATEGDVKDETNICSAEALSTSGDKIKTTKKTKKKRKTKVVAADVKDSEGNDSSQQLLEQDDKPKITKSAKKKLKRKTSTDDIKNGNNLENNAVETSEPAAKRTKEEEAEEEEEEDENCKDVALTSDDFEITPDMIIWKAMFLPDSLVRAVWELGFHNPTSIQLAVLPTAMKGRKDIVGAAETGSGKTLAFGIPILHGILKDKEFEQRKSENADCSESNSDNEEEQKADKDSEETPQQASTEQETEEVEEINEGIGCVRVIDNIDFGLSCKPVSRKKLRALIITPTRELAVQIEKHLKAVAKYTDIKMALVIGGMAAPKQERILNKGPDIVIGTPGRLWELIEGGNPHLAQVTDIRYLALDETDRLLEKGHFTEVRSLLEHINKDESKKRWRQNFVFSATLTLAHDLPHRLGPKKNKKNKDLKLNSLLNLVDIRPKAKIVDLTSSAKQIKPASLSEMKLFSATLEDKDYYLYYFLRHHPGRTLVFCNSINNVRRLTSVFTLLEMNPFPLHAQMHQKQRLKHLEKFSGQDNSLLIATDVAARGLDIPNVVNVVHFQIPRTSENYVHRSGRTARASRDGLSLMLIEPGEAGLYRQLCHTLKKDKTDLPDYEVDMKVLSAVKQRVNLARSIETLEHRTKRERSDESWVKKMAEEADILVDNDGYDSDNDPTHELAKLTNELKNKRKELSRLLSRPLKRSAAT